MRYERIFPPGLVKAGKIVGRAVALLPVLIIAVALLWAVLESGLSWRTNVPEGRLEVLDVPNGSTAPLAVFLAALVGSNFLGWLQLGSSSTEAYNGCWYWLQGIESYWNCTKGLARPIVALAAVLFSGSAIHKFVTNGPECPDCLSTRPPIEEVLLPQALRVHFDNAETDPGTADLNGKGTDLGSERAASVDAIVATLAHCVDSGNSHVEVTVVGFASNDGFSGFPKKVSDKLNVQAANRRATALQDALKHKVDGLTVRKRDDWKKFDEMQIDRNKRMPGRDPIADRIALLDVSGNTLGKCRIIQ